jgi:spermidine synthase
MGSVPTASFPFARLAGVGAVVFLANAALLVLQLVASRLLAPFIGSDLYTWTAIIGVFLLGIALGNAYGGKLADRYPSPRTLAAVLLVGAAAAIWMAFAPLLFNTFYRAIPLGPRIPLLAALLCFPAGFVLSLLTPLSIKLGLPDVSKTGRVAGTVFALSTLGCLLGNYATGFYLIPLYRIDTLVYVATGSLLVLAIGVFAVMKLNPPRANEKTPVADAAGSPANPHAFSSIRQAFMVVFLASFCGMTLELAASRVIAEKLGVSLFTWTGIIGVMLAGTALGNLTGGFLADRANRPEGMRRAVAWLAAVIGGLYVFCLVAKGVKPLLNSLEIDYLLDVVEDARLLWSGAACGLAAAVAIYFGAVRLANEVTPRSVLAATLIAAGAGTVCIFVTRAVLNHSDGLDKLELVNQVLVWTFALFFLPMFALGMISPQVIRLAVPDVAHVGQVAGRVYAWSTAGAIAGTFATGYLLVSMLGVDRTVLGASAVLVCIGCALMSRLYLRMAVSVCGAGLLFSLLPGDWLLAARIAVALAAAAVAWTDVAIRLARARSKHGSLAEVLVALQRSDAREASAGVFIYAISIVLGGITGGFILLGRMGKEDDLAAMVETNYYKIKVRREYKLFDEGRMYTGELSLYLDHLLHSSVNLNDPTYIYYPHEHMQMEFLWAAQSVAPNPKVLVVGGGGYTFPRYAKTLLPETQLDVVEIDPGVTRVAYEFLGLKKELGIRDFNMDGRQFVAEKAEPHSYDLIVQDAVNDLSVPAHLLTREYNDAVKAALKPNGVYLLTIIDEIEYGKLWRASMATLRQTFAHVLLLTTSETPTLSPDMPLGARQAVEWQFQEGAKDRHVYVIYGSDRPIDLRGMHAKNVEVAILRKKPLPFEGRVVFLNPRLFSVMRVDMMKPRFYTHILPDEFLEPFLRQEPGLILTDQFAPVDNLMADVFRRRNRSH